MHIYLRRWKKEVGSEFLLRSSLMQYVATYFPERDPAAFLHATIKRDPKGKPYFEKFPEIHFSISHSRELWGCAFGSSPLGLDLEMTAGRMTEKRPGQTTERWRLIARRFFSAQEYEYVERYGREAFFRVWVRKEAFVKCLGTGLSGELNRFSVIENGMPVDVIKGKSCIGIALSNEDFLADAEAAFCCTDEKDKTYKITIAEE